MEQLQIFAWDWKEQPPVGEIVAFAAGVAASGSPVVARMFPTGSDDYACVVADREVTDEEALAILYADPAEDEEER